MHLSPEARRIKIADRWQMQTINLTSHFLIAMPAMTDTNFSRTLTFVCEHNERGALGIVVNRPIDVTLEALFRQADLAYTDEEFDAEIAHIAESEKVSPAAMRDRLIDSGAMAIVR